MKLVLTLTTIGLVALAFTLPASGLIIIAMVTGFLALGWAPAGYRRDGKRKAGGLLGPAWDAIFDKGPQRR